MKKIFLIIAAIILMYSFSSAQTIIPAGNVSGTWTFAGSPYLIQGAIMIPNGSTLTIQPGVTVNFQGAYKLHVQGRLLAIGTVADTITFTATDTTIGWRGIRYDNTPATNDTSKFIYCKLQYGKATAASPYDNGGAFYFNNSSKVIITNCRISNCMANTSGGGIYCTGSSPIITHNTIYHNKASNGGGIDCEYNSNPTISNNTISNNTAFGLGYSGGGIDCFQSSPIISNNIISYNSASYSGGGINCYLNYSAITNNTISSNSAFYSGGGIECGTASSPNISNNIISNNTANYGGGMDCGSNSSNPSISNNTISNNNADKGGALSFTSKCSPTIHNTIMWGNTASTSGQQVYLDDENCDPNFYYCDVQDSTAAFGLNGSIFYTGIYRNNIDTIPGFVSPSAGSGTGYYGVTNDWSMQAASHCINAGTRDTTGLSLPAKDKAGNPRISGGRIDIGAYEYFFPPNSINEVLINFPIGIYPNPATNNITIEIQQKSEIEILNINGQIIKTIDNNDAKTTIDLGNLSSGVYILKAKTDKGIAIKKFIKE